MEEASHKKIPIVQQNQSTALKITVIVNRGEEAGEGGWKRRG